MTRPARNRVLFALCLAVALVVVVSRWSSDPVLAVQNARERQRHEDRNIQLALQRLNAAILPLYLESNQQPYYVFSRYYWIPRPQRLEISIAMGPQQNLSPLQAGAGPDGICFFQVDPAGTIVSPQVEELTEQPNDFHPGWDLAWYSTLAGDTRNDLKAQECLNHLRKNIRYAQLLKVFEVDPQFSSATHADASLFSVDTNPREFAPRFGNRFGRFSGPVYYRTGWYVGNGFSAVNRISVFRLVEPPRLSSMKGVWIENDLVWVRAVKLAQTEERKSETFVQGIVLDWLALQKKLLAEIADLLPNAVLEPCAEITMKDGAGQVLEDPNRLLLLPVRLVPGELAEARP